MLGTTPVLVRAAIGDDSIPSIGTRPMSQISPNERTTPEGRFRMEPGRNLNKEVVREATASRRLSGPVPTFSNNTRKARK